jgi:2-polyprenyl-6-methoxyphenol hydroxylase-like FAD-dependent oxidoreductase
MTCLVCDADLYTFNIKGENVKAKQAIVIGGSMAGLLAARVLSTHFEEVTILERDPIHNEAEARKGQPQTRHLHGLLAQGFKIMTCYFPDLEQALSDGGAVVGDVGQTMRWYTHGGYRKPFSLGSKAAMMSRPFLEWKIRERVMALPNVRVLAAHDVTRLLTTSDGKEVKGVHVTNRTTNAHATLTADLVIDASGRGSHAPKWLEALGYQKAEENLVKANIGYATRLYRRNPNEAGSNDWLFITPGIPEWKVGCAAFPIEGHRWIVTIGGYHGEHPDAQNFDEIIRSFPASDVQDIITKNEALSDVIQYKFPASLRRRYENLKRFPEGFLVMGDAMCSFNPLYGQGMTVAALEADALDKLLSTRKSLSGIFKPFFKQAAKAVDNPWKIAVGADFGFPETEGKKAPGTNLINAYMTKVQRASTRDEVVSKAFIKVTHLLDTPMGLFKPNIMLRVLTSGFRQRRKSKALAPGSRLEPSQLSGEK